MGTSVQGWEGNIGSAPEFKEFPNANNFTYGPKIKAPVRTVRQGLDSHPNLGMVAEPLEGGLIAASSGLVRAPDSPW